MDTASKQVLRPLHVLIPLIKADLQAAKEAAEEASIPHWRSAAEKMDEAKEQINTTSEFYSWAYKHFGIRERQVQRYLSYYIHSTKSRRESDQSPSLPLSSLSSAMRGLGLEPSSGRSRADPIKEKIARVVQTPAFHKEKQNRAQEYKLLRRLALEMIDIGYKALAAKLHPDKPGGSQEAMQRLNRARDRAKSVFPAPTGE